MFASSVWSIAAAVVFCFLVVHVEGMSFRGSAIKDRFLQSNNNDDNPYSYAKVPSELSANPGKDLALLLALSRERPSQLEAEPTMIFSKIDSTGQWMPPNYPDFSVQNGATSAEFLPMEKREGHSLSIVNPLDVLRQRMMLEMARRRMKENQAQIKANDVILKTLGKRAKDDCDEDGSAKKRRGADKDERRRRQDPYLDSHQDPDDFVV